MATKIKMIVCYWKTKRSIVQGKQFLKNNLKQYSLIITAVDIIFWRKISDTLVLLWENNILSFLKKSLLFPF